MGKVELNKIQYSLEVDFCQPPIVFVDRINTNSIIKVCII